MNTGAIKMKIINRDFMPNTEFGILQRFATMTGVSFRLD